MAEITVAVYKHKCLHCDGNINPGQNEIRVTNTRGNMKGSVRFRHADEADCLAVASPPAPVRTRAEKAVLPVYGSSRPGDFYSTGE